MAQRLSQITRSPARHLWCQEKRSCAVWARGVFSSSSDSSTGRPRIQACRATPITAWLTCSAKGIDDPQPFFERSEEHTSELQSLMRISYAVFCLKKKKNN